jgi:hypothetical protein
VAPLDRAVHEALWLAGSAMLRRGRPRWLPPPGVRHVTTIVRVPAEVGAALEPVLERLRGLDPGHHYYAAGTLHVTLANLDRLHAPLDRVEEAIAASPPFELTLGRLSLSPGTVLVRTSPLDPRFLRLRRDLRVLTEPPAGLRGVALDSLLGRIAFANVVRFSGPVGRPFLDEVGRFRRHEFGRWTAAEVELVETDRLLSPASTRVLARIPLSGRA